MIIAVLCLRIPPAELFSNFDPSSEGIIDHHTAGLRICCNGVTAPLRNHFNAFLMSLFFDLCKQSPIF